MSQKPRLEVDNKGIEHLITQPREHPPDDEQTVVIENTCTSKHDVPSSRLTPNVVTAPKTYGN